MLIEKKSKSLEQLGTEKLVSMSLVYIPSTPNVGHSRKYSDFEKFLFPDGNQDKNEKLMARRTNNRFLTPLMV